MGQSSGVLFKEVSAFQRCPIIEVLLYIYVKKNFCHTLVFVSES